MKIALIQTNPLIGNFKANCAKINRLARQARDKGCVLAIFPELAISGYPPQDLLEHQSFVIAQEQALTELVRQCSGIAILCGAITRNRKGVGKPLHNSALLFKDGEIIFTIHKKLLPTYDVFDESRYFEPGTGSRSITFQGLKLGITICEDIFNDKDVVSHRLYQLDPLAELCDKDKPELLINIAASPYNLGKPQLRQDIFSRLCVKYNRPLLYVNQVGGQDSILFDGRSLVFNNNGELITAACAFQEDMLIVDNADFYRDAPIATGKVTKTNDTADMFTALVMGTRDYMKKCGFSKGIIGLSGGIDSALTATIAARALGPENVMGVTLPSPYSSRGSIDDSKQLAENLGISFEIIPIGNLFDSYRLTLAPLFEGLTEDVTEQNIQARIRGNLLMALANKFNALLLSTGNKSEMAVGYCTLYGDMSGGLALISDVPKMLVYDLARYVNEKEEIIPVNTLSKPPSAELAPDQLDQDDLPPYEILDAILKAWLEEQCGLSEIVAMGFERTVVEDVIRRIKRNEYKRKQAPMGLKVTSKAFGIGRRYPTAEQFWETL